MGRRINVFVDTPRDRAHQLMLVDCGPGYRDRLRDLVSTLVQARRVPVSQVRVVTSQEPRLSGWLLVDFTSAGPAVVDMAVAIILREARQSHQSEFSRLGMSADELATAEAIRSSPQVKVLELRGL